MQDFISSTAFKASLFSAIVLQSLLASASLNTTSQSEPISSETHAYQAVVTTDKDGQYCVVDTSEVEIAIPRGDEATWSEKIKDPHQFAVGNSIEICSAEVSDNASFASAGLYTEDSLPQQASVAGTILGLTAYYGLCSVLPVAGSESASAMLGLVALAGMYTVCLPVTAGNQALYYIRERNIESRKQQEEYMKKKEAEKQELLIN